MLNVTKTFLPPLSEYTSYLEKIWKNGQVTNEGQFVKELETELSKLTGVKNVIYVSNGTIAIQLAIKALEIKGDIITTPFSYCATTNSIIWEECNPIFADINKQSLTCELADIQKVFTQDTKAILTTHVYGNANDLDSIEHFGRENNMPIIFDAAHCFGVKYKGKSIFNYGTVSTCSFHATKIFHTVEGGAVFTNDDKLASKIRLLKSFGHKSDDYFIAGINGKSSELHAAMGLLNLSYFDRIKNHRREVSSLYEKLIKNNSRVKVFNWSDDIDKNYSYFPIILQTEKDLLYLTDQFKKENIFPRRYFYPSLNKLPFLKSQNCPIAEDISIRILCLPLSAEISEEEVRKVCLIINNSLK